MLFEAAGEPGTINRLGVETETAAAVVAAEARLAGSGLQTTGVDEKVCCYAEKTGTWVRGPDNTRWEWYVKQGDAAQMESRDLQQPRRRGLLHLTERPVPFRRAA